MPELPEVETTKRGIQQHIENQKITRIVVRQHKLRWPIIKNLDKKMAGKTIYQVSRRAKYLLIQTDGGNLILHLGMSGSLRILTEPTPPNKHDHFDIELANQKILRFTDPRRFGALLWTDAKPEAHLLLCNLGPEPLTAEFSANYLYQKSRPKKTAIKSFIMDNHVVVGVGNIYATEVLFLAKIHPLTPANKLSLEQFKQIATITKQVLKNAIKNGGTTLKDFTKSDGKPGYFRTKLQAYGRTGLPCFECKTEMQSFVVGQRTTTYCPSCQPPLSS